MTEGQWTERMRQCLEGTLSETPYKVYTGRKIPYGFEIRSYEKDDPKPNVNHYETDLVVVHHEGEQSWKPRVIVEAKKSITTHDVIIYSQKALSHKTIHPYLRYGIMLGNGKPLPWRLYRHGVHFDFMISFLGGTQPSKPEIEEFGKIIRAEIDASRKLDKIIYESRHRDRNHYTILHRKLCLK